MRSFLPDISGSVVLDISCGFGKNCKFYAEAGASRVVGIDISSKMITLARETHADDVVVRGIRQGMN
jgi:ubiquinone/menaquinone biosynthesis C-methylase UbiE